MDKRKSLGLVLGRFQPLHPGHLYLIGRAFKENDVVIVCIGSAQLSQPFSIKKRHKRIEAQLKILGYQKERYRIIDLIDPEPMGIWPSYVKKVCGIMNDTRNTFYRADRLPEKYRKELIKLGFRVRIIRRKPFYFRGPDGFYRLVTSASEIRDIHKKLGEEIK